MTIPNTPLKQLTIRTGENPTSRHGNLYVIGEFNHYAERLRYTHCRMVSAGKNLVMKFMQSRGDYDTKGQYGATEMTPYGNNMNRFRSMKSLRYIDGLELGEDFKPILQSSYMDSEGNIFVEVSLEKQTSTGVPAETSHMETTPVVETPTLDRTSHMWTIPKNMPVEQKAAMVDLALATGRTFELEV